MFFCRKCKPSLQGIYSACADSQCMWIHPINPIHTESTRAYVLLHNYGKFLLLYTAMKWEVWCPKVVDANHKNIWNNLGEIFLEDIRYLEGNFSAPSNKIQVMTNANLKTTQVLLYKWTLCSIAAKMLNFSFDWISCMNLNVVMLLATGYLIRIYVNWTIEVFVKEFYAIKVI